MEPRLRGSSHRDGVAVGLASVKPAGRGLVRDRELSVAPELALTALTIGAVVPSLTLFVFSSALGPDKHRVLYTIVYLAGVLVFVLVSTATRRAETTSWFAGRRGGGASTIAQGGVRLATAGVVVAALVGPALPGAHSASLVQWRHHDGNSGPRTRVTVSPLVDIQSRLLDQGTTEFFTVKTTGAVPRYWRLTALDDFDGT